LGGNCRDTRRMGRPQGEVGVDGFIEIGGWHVAAHVAEWLGVAVLCVVFGRATLAAV